MYEGLQKTITIWVNLCPRKDARNAVFFHSFYVRKQGAEDSPRPSCLDDVEGIEVNTGSSKDVGATEILRMLNTLFDAEMKINAKRTVLKDKYNIDLDQSLLEEVGRMGALAEEYEIVRARGLREGRAAGFAQGRAEGIAQGKAEGIAQGKAEGIAEGRVEGRAEGRAEGKAEERQRVVEALSEKVLAFCSEHDVSVEEAVAEVVFLPDYVPDVLEALKRAA